MKLVLMWLVGVPALVAVMVLARAMSPRGMHGVAAHRTLAQVQVTQSCGRQVQFDDVLLAVANDRHGIACNQSSID
jgi:hypothetical protein